MQRVSSCYPLRSFLRHLLDKSSYIDFYESLADGVCDIFALKRIRSLFCTDNSLPLTFLLFLEAFLWSRLIMSSSVCNWILNCASWYSMYWVICSCWTSRSYKVLRTLAVCDCCSECIWLCTKCFSLSPAWRRTWCSRNVLTSLTT